MLLTDEAMQIGDLQTEVYFKYHGVVLALWLLESVFHQNCYFNHVCGTRQIFLKYGF